MEFLNIQLQYQQQELTLSIQNSKETQTFPLYGQVSDPQEFAHQAALFVAIHLRPYFDTLPVDSCHLNVSSDVPFLVNEACQVELVKLTKTNDLLLWVQGSDALASHQVTDHILGVYSEQMSLEGLLNMCDFDKSEKATCIGYLETQLPTSLEEQQLRLFESSPQAWADWYVESGFKGIYAAQDFVQGFEKQGVVLSSLLRFLKQELYIIDGDYPLASPMQFFENRSIDSQSMHRFVQDIQSLIWGRWLGLHNTSLGTLKSVEDEYDPLVVLDAFRQKKWTKLKCRPHQKLHVDTDSLLKQNENLSFLICEDLYLRRLQQWLPQAYFIKGMLDKHLGQDISSVASIDIWQAVMRRLIVGSAESTDYDIIILVRRMELIAEAAKTLALIEFIQNLKGKAQVHVCGHGDWQQIFPEYYREAGSVLEWEKAAAKYSSSTFLQMESVLHPALSRRIISTMASGQTTAVFSTLHQICGLTGKALPELQSVQWLQQHNVVNTKAACVHAMSASSQRDSMQQKCQSIFKLLHQHNSTRFNQIQNMQMADVQTLLDQEISQVLDCWHQAGEDFYNLYPDIFQESLMVLNPQVNFDMTDELLQNLPDYLKVVVKAEAKKYA